VAKALAQRARPASASLSRVWLGERGLPGLKARAMRRQRTIDQPIADDANA